MSDFFCIIATLKTSKAIALPYMVFLFLIN